MPKGNVRLDAVRKAYREALEAARESPTSEAWERLLAAGKDLSAAEAPRSRGRRGRRPQGSAQVGEPAERGPAEPLDGVE